jgi:hypothetical protein
VVTVGEVADMLAKVSESVEVLWEGAAAVAGIEALGAAVHVSGELARASVPRVKLDAAIDALRGAGARLISVTPVQATLEDYFMQQVGASEAAAAEARA